MRESGGYFGLTGGLACGKSTVASFLRERGAQIIDADRVGHELLRRSLPAYRELLEAFGKDIIDGSGEIDRKRLGVMVFSDGEKLRRLNAILHPRIIERVEESAAEARSANPSAVVIVDAALIFEAGIGGRFRKVIAAWCRPEQQIERCMAKTGLSRAEAEQRLCSQMSADEKRRRADFVLDCSGTLEETRRQVDALLPKLQRLASEV
jgi:dephospho-CoA kinase